MHSFYLDAIRNFEGYTPRASWDYAQFSNGYGTRARYAGEVIDRAEAERRFRAEVSSARSIVEKAAPHVDEGTKAALTSLTYNAGTAWISSGLGDAVRRGDLEAARDIFRQYNKAGGEVLPGLVNRRAQEALWIGNPDAAATTFASYTAATDTGTTALPPVVVDRDQSARQVAEAIQSRTSSHAEGGPSRTAGTPFERGPRAERLALSGPLANVANEALMALVGNADLGPSGATEIVRLVQLGKGSELAKSDKERQGSETRRV
jgi:lysozyme